MVTMTKTLLESGVLGAVTGKRVWNARLIASGVSLNGKYYSGEMLESTGPAAFPFAPGTVTKSTLLVGNGTNAATVSTPSSRSAVSSAIY